MPQNRSLPLFFCIGFGMFLAAPGLSRGQVAPPKVVIGRLEFSNDSNFVMTGGDKTRVFEISTGKLQRVFDGAPWLMEFSPAVRNVCAYGREGAGERIWEITKPDVIRELSPLHEKETFNGEFRDFHCVIDNSGRFIARCYARYNKFKFPYHLDEGRFRLSDMETGNDLQSIDVKDGGVQGVVFSEDGKFVAFFRNMNTKGSTVEVYRVNPWESAASIKLTTGALKGEPYGTHMRFIAGSQRFLVAGGVLVDSGPGEIAGTRGYLDHGLLWIVDFTMKPAATLLGEPLKNEHYESLSVSPDGKMFVTQGERLKDGGKLQIEMREVATRKLVWQAERGYQPTISPNGKYVGLTVSPEIRLLDAKTGKLVQTIDASK